jgi:outer membrane receptor protein involved in Fe transport
MNLVLATTLLALAGGFAATKASAQAQDSASQGYIEEITVTASKRAQTLQEVPIAVSVVSGEVLEKAQIQDIKDLQSLVPSLRVTQLQTTGNTNFIIRGFGNGANNAGIEPSVGVFIDGVYRSRSASALADLPNLERIEVLRGPQSTLFGKNASAGVISVITAKPDLDAYSGSASLTVGDLSQITVKGDVTGPLSDTVAFSLSGNINQRDGYFTNLTNGEEFNEHDRWGVRGQLLFQPSDKLELRFIADHEEMDEFCCGVANIQDGPSSTIIRLIGGEILTEDPFARAQYYTYDAINEIENSGFSLQVDYDFDRVTLTSITSLRDMSRTDNADSDFTSADLLNPVLTNTDIETFTQELRLTSSGEGAVDWMIGGFYFDEEVEIDNTLLFGEDFRAFGDIGAIIATGGIPGLDPSPLDGLELLFMLPPGTFYAPGTGFMEVAGQDNQAFSVFGTIDWHINDRVTLTLGANYTEDEKDAFINIASTDVFSSIDFVQTVYAQTFTLLTTLPPTPENIAAFPAADFAANLVSTTDCTPITAPNCNPLLPLQAGQFLPPFLDFPNAVEPGSSNDDEVTWTVRLAFDATDNVNIYLGAATGFKATSWNLSRDSRPFESDMEALGAGPNDRLGPPNLVSGTRFAAPEEATVYEIGLKARFDRGSINIAVFDQEIKEFQSNLFLGAGFVLANAGKQSTTGVEIDANWVPTDALTLTFAGTWMDPVYDSFENAEGPGGPTDLSGTQVPGVHEFSMVTSGTYNFDIGASTSGFVRAEYIYEDEVQIIENVPASVASREVSTVNASIGLQWDNGFEAMLWGRNLTDDDYLLSAFPTTVQTDRTSGYPNEPRTYGLTLTKRFN